MRRVLLLTSMMGTLAACGAEPGTDKAAENGTTDYSNNTTSNNTTYTPSNNDYYAEESNNTTAGAPSPPPIDGENYQEWQENDFIETATEATSTFSIDVDTASYTLMRRDINSGRLPAVAGVRVEEYINFFEYEYPQPIAGEPFSINLEVAPSVFGTDLHMLRVGLYGRDIALENMRATNLVFLIDVSGSMSTRLPLVKHALTTLTNRLRPGDKVAIVTYASNPGVLLSPTDISDKATILSALNGLVSGGSTNGAGGIESAYALAEATRGEDTINRVVLVTDGDFNVGVTGSALVDLVEAKRDLHIGLTVAGFGSGNYNDADLEAFARQTNGNYFYIDGEAEADRIFGTDLVSTLEVIAADVKIQVAFDADAVVRYRLVGYENRLLENQDFEDDSKDAGEIGPGHTVTALYEIELAADVVPASGSIAEVRLRHKAQFGADSLLQTQSIKPSQVKADIADASADLRFAMAVIEFAEILRQSMHTEGMRIDDIETLATGATSTQLDRSEFIELVGLARPLLLP